MTGAQLFPLWLDCSCIARVVLTRKIVVKEGIKLV
jgi:hypothetical protein